METNFKVGQKVWDAVIAPGIEGKVKNIIDDVIVVMFDYQQRTYLLSGRYYNDFSPTLSAVPYEFKLPEQPEYFEFDELVLVRDRDCQEWLVDRYVGLSGNNDYPFSVRSCIRKQIRKFDAELAYRK